MDEPIRLTILKALTAHLETIVHVEGTADWAGFNLAGKVFRGINRFGDEAPTTFVSVLEAPRPDSGRTAGDFNASRSEEWPLLVQGWTTDDKDNPTDNAYWLMRVVEIKLAEIIEVKGTTGSPKYPDAFLLGGLISSFSFGPGVVRPPTEGISSKAFFYLPVRVGLATVV